MDTLIARISTLLICLTAAAAGALGLGILHVPLPFTHRWAACVVFVSAARLAASSLDYRS